MMGPRCYNWLCNRTARRLLKRNGPTMISPDILKRSAVAGALSVAVVGGVFALAPELSEEETAAQAADLDAAGTVSLDSDTRMPQPVARKAPPPEESKVEVRSRFDVDLEPVRIRARDRAAERAMERLQNIHESHGVITEAPRVNLLQLRIDRARRAAQFRSNAVIVSPRE